MARYISVAHVCEIHDRVGGGLVPQARRPGRPDRRCFATEQRQDKAGDLLTSGARPQAAGSGCAGFSLRALHALGWLRWAECFRPGWAVIGRDRP